MLGVFDVDHRSIMMLQIFQVEHKRSMSLAGALTLMEAKALLVTKRYHQWFPFNLYLFHIPQNTKNSKTVYLYMQVAAWTTHVD